MGLSFHYQAVRSSHHKIIIKRDFMHMDNIPVLNRLIGKSSSFSCSQSLIAGLRPTSKDSGIITYEYLSSEECPGANYHWPEEILESTCCPKKEKKKKIRRKNRRKNRRRERKKRKKRRKKKKKKKKKFFINICKLFSERKKETKTY